MLTLYTAGFLKGEKSHSTMIGKRLHLHQPSLGFERQPIMLQVKTCSKNFLLLIKMKSVDYQNIVYSFAIISKRINCQNIDMVIILVDHIGSAKAGQMVTY